MTGTGDIIDFSKVALIAGVSILAGVFLGSRTGGIYEFEIGYNLAEVVLYIIVIVIVLIPLYMAYTYYMTKLAQKHELEMKK